MASSSAQIQAAMEEILVPRERSTAYKEVVAIAFCFENDETGAKTDCQEWLDTLSYACGAVGHLITIPAEVSRGEQIYQMTGGIRETLVQSNRRMEPWQRSLGIFYYAGHGADPNFTQAGYLLNSEISWQAIEDQLMVVYLEQVDIFAFIDACYSGWTTRAKVDGVKSMTVMAACGASVTTTGRLCGATTATMLMCQEIRRQLAQPSPIQTIDLSVMANRSDCDIQLKILAGTLVTLPRRPSTPPANAQTLWSEGNTGDEMAVAHAIVQFRLEDDPEAETTQEFLAWLTQLPSSVGAKVLGVFRVQSTTILCILHTSVADLLFCTLSGQAFNVIERKAWEYDWAPKPATTSIAGSDHSSDELSAAVDTSSSLQIPFSSDC